MKIKTYPTHRLVKSEDLNHHGTLFAGRSAEWFVESGFIAASSLLPPKNLICLKIHGMTFSQPVMAGQAVCFNSKIVSTGKSSLTAYVSVSLVDHPVIIVDGFLTFVHVNDDTKPIAHNIIMEPETPEDAELQEKAKSLKRK